MDTRCISLVCFTTRIQLSTQWAKQWDLLFSMGIPTAYTCAWGYNIHYCIFLHLVEKVNIILLAGSQSSNWRISISGVQQRDRTAKKELSLRRYYGAYSLHFPYITPRCYVIPEWSLCWHWYILPCDPGPVTQDEQGCKLVEGSSTAHTEVWLI